jgi:hypothetical protein
MIYLDILPLLVPLQSVAFWGLLSASTITHNVKVFVSRYQSIDMHCTVVPVKFDGGLSISFLRKKQLFANKRRSKIYISEKVPIFKTSEPPPIEERTGHPSGNATDRTTGTEPICVY